MTSLPFSQREHFRACCEWDWSHVIIYFTFPIKCPDRELHLESRCFCLSLGLKPWDLSVRRNSASIFPFRPWGESSSLWFPQEPISYLHKPSRADFRRDEKQRETLRSSKTPIISYYILTRWKKNLQVYFFFQMSWKNIPVAWMERERKYPSQWVLPLLLAGKECLSDRLYQTLHFKGLKLALGISLP